MNGKKKEKDEHKVQTRFLSPINYLHSFPSASAIHCELSSTSSILNRRQYQHDDGALCVNVHKMLVELSDLRERKKKEIQLRKSNSSQLSDSFGSTWIN